MKAVRAVTMALVCILLLPTPQVAAQPATGKGAKATKAPRKFAPTRRTPPKTRRSSASLVNKVPELGKCRRDPLAGAVVKKPKQTGPLTARERELQLERLAYDKVVERFMALGNDYRREVAIVLENAFRTRQDSLSQRYGKESGELDLIERQRRDDAIARFRKFIKKYPNNLDHTPDAMFRLAELYYEKSAIDYADAEERYAKDLALYERGKIPSKPQSPRRDYSESIGLYRDLIARFGDTYRYADAVYYLFGYVQQESGEDLASRKTWLAMVERFPKSEYAPEVFLRIGENHFDYGEFNEAAELYKRALAYTESRFYDKALYKLAWTYFQVYDYDRAIKTFKQLIAWYDKAGATEGTSSALREEAIDYLAKSLAEDDWDNDGLDDDNHGVQRALAYMNEGKPYENDIVAKYAQSLYDLHDKKKYVEAVEVYRYLIDRDPTALRSVDHQQQIIKIYDVLRDIESATLERQRLAEMFAPGSAWQRANRAHQKRVGQATEAVENAMRRRALFLHQRAQELKAQAKIESRPELLDESLAHYEKASKAYGDYLQKYPTEPRSYEMRFYLAETLYYSAQFHAAAGVYLEVAGDPHQSKFREPAAWSAVKSYEKILTEATESGRIPNKANPQAAWQPEEAAEADDQQSTDARQIMAEPMPLEAQEWIKAVDFYVLRDIKRDGSRLPQAALSYQAADLKYRFKDYEDARSRFRQVIACFPQDETAAYAMANIINSYRDENDWANLEKWANIADRVKLGDKELQKKIQRDIKTFKLGAQFQRAETLLKEKRYLEAAREFERLADQNPTAKFLDKAYYNGAIAYKEVKYYDSASRIFEKLVTDPRFRNSSFKEDSLFELAENYKLFFNFDKAVSTYLTYFQRAKTANPNKHYALFTAARLQEFAGDLRAAAGTYERYADAYQTRDDAANALYRAGQLYAKLKQKGDQRRILKTYIERYNTQPGMGTRVIQSMLTLGDLELAENDWRNASKHYKDVVREYEVRGFQPGTAAAAAAAKAKFELVERDYRTYAKIRLSGRSQRRMTKDVTRKKKLLESLELAFGEVLPYKALDWTIAAFYRLGDIYRDFAQMLYEAPQPNLSEEELEVFTNQIEDLGLQYENVAIERFERTVKESRRLKVTNVWANRALEAINRYKPAEYPLFKETKKADTFTPIFRVEQNIPEAGR